MDSILDYKKCDEDDFYCLLGCDETSSVEQILTEYKALSLKCHPDKNPEDDCAVARFQKILKAKEVLADPEKRALYDKWRRCGFSLPFEKFMNLNKAAHSSIHWACKKEKELMLENSFGKLRDFQEVCHFEKEASCRNETWERDPGSEMLEKFRNYEI